MPGLSEQKEVCMAVRLQWLGHASFKISGEDAVVYIDPWKLSKAAHDATVVLVSHSHYDHYSSDDIAKAAGKGAEIVGPYDVVSKEDRGQAMEPGESLQCGSVGIETVAAYNPNKQFHPKANKWLGFVVTVDGIRIYYAGDTDMVDEMSDLHDIDVALLPVGGTYTMGAEEAAAAAEHIKPRRAVPYHWGDIVGRQSDAERFADLAACEVTILKHGECMEL
jgi:L-ascorbate metabolism protein UlaG (beta-lactamase superfamily)